MSTVQFSKVRVSAPPTPRDEPPPPPNKLPTPSSPIPYSVAFIQLMISPSMRDIRLTLVASLYAAACLYITCISNSIADRINPNNNIPIADRRALPDPVMSFLHPIFLLLRLPDNFSDQLILVAFCITVPCMLTMRGMILTYARRTLFVTGTVYLFRACSVIITVLPNPLLECQSTPKEDLFEDAWLLFTGKRTSCGDVFFSGHTIIFTVCILYGATYSRSSLYRTLSTIVGVLGMVSLIMSSYHYTIDVIVGWWVTTWAWTMYHWTVTLTSLRRTWWGNFLYRLDNADYYKKEVQESIARSGFDLSGYVEVIAVTDE